MKFRTENFLRQFESLAKDNGAKIVPSDWSKVTSKAKNGIETHAYKNVKTGEIVEYKTKEVVTTSKWMI